METEFITGIVEDTIKDEIKVGYTYDRKGTKAPIFHLGEKALTDVVQQHLFG